MTSIRFQFLLLSFQLEENWANNLSNRDNKLRIKQRNCAYHASLEATRIVGYLIKITEFFGLNIRRNLSRLILETSISYFLNLVYMHFTDGMHFKNLDPDGVLSFIES